MLRSNNIINKQKKSSTPTKDMQTNWDDFSTKMTITRKIKNREIDFSFDSAHCEAFMKVG